MPKLIKIHGTSGAGKTSAVRDLMERATFIHPIRNLNTDKVEAYQIGLPGVVLDTYILGSYENTCGGMDTIGAVSDQIHLIHKYAALGHVIYEGLLMSTYYGRLGIEMEQYGSNHIWAFLDTPMDLCIDRIKQRRRQAGNDKPLNESNTRDRQRAIDSLRARVTRLGGRAVTLHHDQDRADQLLEMLS